MSWQSRIEARWASRGRSAPTPPAGAESRAEHLGIHTEIDIARSAQAVWELLRDPANLVLVEPSVVSIEHVTGTGEHVGRQVTIRTDQDGAGGLLVTELLAEEPARYLEARTGAGPGAVRQRIWITHTGQGARVRWQDDLPVPAALTPEQRERLTRELTDALESAARRWAWLAETGQVGGVDEDGCTW